MKQTAILLPVDNRPITYLFPQLMCQLAGLEVITAPRHLMGSLLAPINIDALWHWLEQTILHIDEGAIFVCLDSLLYGGLIPGRRSEEKLKTILARANRVANLKKITGGKIKIYAQSSIMRISDNYDNTEEKSYWSKYGREIFRWSELLHKKEIDLLKAESELQTAQSLITPEVRSDYLATRTRNFTVNQKIIEYVASGYIDYLIFSQDDSGKYGLNVLEKDKLLQLSKEKKADNVRAYAGADEVLMSLVAYYLNSQRQKKPQIVVEYPSPSGNQIASNFEGQTIGNSLECQARAQGLQIVSPRHSDTADNANISKADFTVIVHTAIDKQGDHIWLPGLNDLRRVESSDSSAKTIALIEHAQTPVIICDVAYSNGSDPVLIDLLFKHSHLFEKIWSYAGWNTTGNTIGCALAVGSACLNAMANNELDEQLRRSLLWLRLMDDWAYQTQVRKILMEARSTDSAKVAELMDKYTGIVGQSINFKPASIKYSLPWHRTFEIEIDTNLP